MMADEVENIEENDDSEQPLETSSVGGKGLLIAFVGLVVLLETGMFFFMVPSADQVIRPGRAKVDPIYPRR